ncbi:hypothetical protein GCM10010275_31690 [Streptomyces litmocidini]|uniref:hypothetical protein n=1 Tax=Streptomyces litmocidini TaxID=67318 RepID=UPI00167DCBFD|nr:hypothetical protein [Streptomyces litmocidini]GGU92271.1 hypothetical protein GCM10010275_31690 [Streptomyces litmocidini]
MTVRAAWLQSTGQTREDTRLALAALLTPNGQSAAETPLRSRPGIVPGGLVLTGTSAMQCSIGTGRAVIQGVDTAQGPYMLAVTAPETLTVPDGDPQYGRIDLIELAVLDDAYDRSGSTGAVIRLVKGTPAAAPVAPPSGPGSAFPLYTVSVPAGTSAGTGGVQWTSPGVVTTLHYPMTALGGIIPTSGFKGAYVGQYRDVSGLLQRWDGTTWVSYAKPIGGIAPHGTMTTGAYTGQYRDNAGVLQRWDGSAWQYAEGTAKILLAVTQWTADQAQSIPSNAWTVITMPKVEGDDAGGWNGTDTYVVPRTGWWRISAQITWANDAQTGMRGARVMAGGVGQSRMTWLTPAGNGAISVGGQGLIKLTAGTPVQLAGFHNHTAAIKTLGGSGYACTLTAEWLKA